MNEAPARSVLGDAADVRSACDAGGTYAGRACVPWLAADRRLPRSKARRSALARQRRRSVAARRRGVASEVARPRGRSSGPGLGVDRPGNGRGDGGGVTYTVRRTRDVRAAVV